MGRKPYASPNMWHHVQPMQASTPLQLRPAISTMLVLPIRTVFSASRTRLPSMRWLFMKVPLLESRSVAENLPS